MARREYSAEDKARVYVVLQTNDGNLKRTARDTGIPEPTIRRWRNEWKESGPPALDQIEEAVVEYVTEMEKTRDLALKRIHERLSSPDKKDQGTLPQIATVFGVLTDKIDRAHGIGTKHEHEHKLSLPSPDEIRASLGALIEGVQAGHVVREEEIEDAEILEEPRALPQTTSSPSRDSSD